MKITVIYDNDYKSIDYKSVQFILKQIKSNGINTIVNEFTIANDFNSCFWDCYSECKYYCSYKDEIEDCPYFKIVKNLAHNLNNSDLIILASCSSQHNIGSNMYKVLQNLSYKWMPHKHNNFMINKIALAVSNTTSFAIFPHASMTLSRVLRVWGINKHSIFSKSLSKYNSDNLTQKDYLKLTSELTQLTSKIVHKYRQTSAIIFPDFKNENKAPKQRPKTNSFNKKNHIKKIPLSKTSID
ncbi:MAG TPA: hypothetical protein DG753_09765 [Clostridium sp.]|nr:hypothetical protein [Clostridium sp.]